MVIWNVIFNIYEILLEKVKTILPITCHNKIKMPRTNRSA